MTLISYPNGEFFLILDDLRVTATGVDQLPAWFLRLGPCILRDIFKDALGNHMSASEHDCDVISRCAHSSVIVKTLRSNGMSDEMLQSVILSKLLYASTAWWGFTKSAYSQRTEAFVRCGVRSAELDRQWQWWQSFRKCFYNSTTRNMFCIGKL